MRLLNWAKALGILLFISSSSFGWLCMDKLIFKPFDPVLQIAYDHSFRAQAHHPSDKGLDVLWPFAPFLGRWMGLPQMSKIYRQIRQDNRPISIFEKMRDGMQLRVRIKNAHNLAKIPKTGPLVVFANHPLAGIESIAIAAELQKVRPDFAIFLNSMLENIPELKTDNFIFVNVYDTPRTSESKQKSVRKTMKWLKDSHALILHPSGTVSDLNNPEKIVLDHLWQPGAFRFANSYKAVAVPIYVEGQLSDLFLNIRKFNLNASVPLLIPEILKKIGSEVVITIGEPIFYDAYKDLSPEAGTEMLRRATYSLAQ